VDGSIFTTGLGKVMYNFIEDLVAKRQPNQSLWDLQGGNRDALAFRCRVNFLRRLLSGIILFDFGQYSTVLWKIAVSEAATALYICRLDPEFDEMDIARNLLHAGISFKTLLPLNDIPRSLPFDTLALPIRLSGYVFTKKDYDAYLHQRAVSLRSGGGRAALLHGGILWCLAMVETSVDLVLQGPSASVCLYRDGLSVMDPLSADNLWDDQLSEMSVLLLCGTYQCYTGK
jgi:hypothetical protein